MNTIHRQKVVIQAVVLELRDEEGHVVREVQSRQAVLYHPFGEQLESLMRKLEVDVLDELNEAGQPTQMALNGSRMVSREVPGNGKELPARVSRREKEPSDPRQGEGGPEPGAAYPDGEIGFEGAEGETSRP